MTRAEIEQRLLDIAREIESAQTVIWLREHEREQLRTELRRHLQAEDKAGAA
jgi:hypothetical protein